MTHKLRTVAVILVLVGGIMFSLPMQPGSLDTGPGAASYPTADPASFSVTLRRGVLTIAGHTVSSRHEASLRKIAAEHFPGRRLQASFNPLVVAPGWWRGATEELLAALASLKSPSASLSTDVLRITGVTRDAAATELLLPVLPDAVRQDVRIEHIATNTSAAMLCRDQLGSLDVGPVNFAESGTELRPSAYPVLDRIVELADACRDSIVSITGHTDSTGDETWNRQLSLMRAETVAVYLGERGVAPGRLLVAGAGSAMPIVDNGTRYGRGINRRIEFELMPGRPD